MTPTLLPYVNNINISTDTAHMIAAQLKDVFDTHFWDLHVLVPIIITGLSFLAASMSAFSAYKANSIAESIQNSELLKLFFDVTRELPMDGKTPLTDDHKQYICNYFEFMAMVISKKRFSRDENELIEGAMNTPLFISFMIDYRKRHGTSSFKNYYKWHEQRSKKHG